MYQCSEGGIVNLCDREVYFDFRVAKLVLSTNGSSKSEKSHSSGARDQIPVSEALGDQLFWCYFLGIVSLFDFLGDVRRT